MDGIVRSSPILADVDADGRLELIVGVGSAIYLFQTNAKGADWPMFKGDVQNSGNLTQALTNIENQVLNKRISPWTSFRLGIDVYIRDLAEYIAYQIDKRCFGYFGSDYAKNVY